MGGGWSPLRVVAVCVAAAVLGGFGLGFVTGQAMSPHGPHAAGAVPWPFFGKPRAANAPRARS